MKALLLILLPLAALAQPMVLELQAPSAPAVQNISASYLGSAAAVTDLFYWVVARYPAGMSVPAGPLSVRTAGDTALSANNVRLNWMASPGATGYDVLRSSTSAFPGPCNCAVALNTASTTVTDSGGALSAWPSAGVNFVSAARMTLTLDNLSESLPFLKLLGLYSGSARVAVLSGSFTSGNAASIDSNGRIVDAGAMLIAPSSIGTFANRPAAAASNSGSLYFSTDGLYVSRSNGSSYDLFGPVYPFFAPSDPGTSVNFGSSSISSAGGVVTLTAAASAGDNLRLRCMAAPATPYTWTAFLTGLQDSAANAQFGIGFRSSGTAALAVASVDNNNLAAVIKWTNPSLFSAAYAFAAYRINPGGVWMRISDDGVNRITSFSNDGRTFVSHTVGRTDFLTADQVCIYGNPANNDDAIITVYSLRMQ